MPQDEDELLESLEESILKPKRVRGDSGEVEQHDPSKLIELIKLKRQITSQRTGIGIRYVKLIPPGTV